MWRDIRKRRLSEQLLPMIGKTAKGIIVSISWKDIGSKPVRPSGLQKFHHGKPNGADRSSLFAVREAQAARFGVHLGPLEANDFAAAAAGQGDLANDIDSDGVFLVLGCRAQHLAQRPIFRFSQPAVADIVSRLADAVSWIVLDDSGFDGIGEDAS